METLGLLFRKRQPSYIQEFRDQRLVLEKYLGNNAVKIYPDMSWLDKKGTYHSEDGVVRPLLISSLGFTKVYHDYFNYLGQVHPLEERVIEALDDFGDGLYISLLRTETKFIYLTSNRSSLSRLIPTSTYPPVEKTLAFFFDPRFQTMDAILFLGRGALMSYVSEIGNQWYSRNLGEAKDAWADSSFRSSALWRLSSDGSLSVNRSPPIIQRDGSLVDVTSTRSMRIEKFEDLKPKKLLLNFNIGIMLLTTDGYLYYLAQNGINSGYWILVEGLLNKFVMDVEHSFSGGTFILSKKRRGVGTPPPAISTKSPRGAYEEDVGRKLLT